LPELSPNSGESYPGLSSFFHIFSTQSYPKLGITTDIDIARLRPCVAAGPMRLARLEARAQLGAGKRSKGLVLGVLP